MSHLRRPRLPRAFGLAPTLALALVLAACAVPQAPTGGPQDQTPPTIASTVPAANSVNVDADVVTITFSERVDAPSFGRALSITPAFEAPPTYKWKKRQVEVRFPAPLRPNTTYLLTIDNTLRDAHGVTLAQPLTFAFATGPTIDQGEIRGRVLEPQRGGGLAGLDVLAYALPDTTAPDTLAALPTYRTQTDPEGRFTFTYLNEQPYYVVALTDRNANRRPDALEPYAVPPRAALLADTLGGTAGRWFITTLDTLPPVLRQVRPLARTRLALRFDDAVRIAAPATADPLAGWILEDSLTGLGASVLDRWRDPTDPRQVVVATSPLSPVRYRIRATGLADSSGNAVRPDTLFFTGSTASDTLQLRFLGFADTPGAPDAEGHVLLAPGTYPTLRFNQPLDSTVLATAVALADTAGQPLAFTATRGGPPTYTLQPTSSPPDGMPVTASVNGRLLGTADSLFTRTFRFLGSRDLGDLSGVVQAADATGRVVLELYPATANAAAPPFRIAVADTTGTFRFADLPGGRRYRLRAFVDHDADRQWDGGRLLPYRPAEPLAWGADTLRVRARWDTVLEDTLRIQ